MLDWQTTLPISKPAILIVPALLFLVIGALDRRLRGAGTSLWEHLFPRRIYRAQANAIGRFNYVLSLSLLFKGAGGVSAMLLAQTLIAPAAAPATALLAVTVQVLCVWLAHDLGNYCQHWLQHRSAFLWRFHRPHHAVEALTPFVQVQGHPIDLLIGMAVAFPFTFAGAALGLWLSGGSFGAGALAGLAVVAGIEQLKGALGHSHLAISFGWWNRLVLAPVMHQLHHSAEIEHRDCNLGSTFGLWDWMFGTLYVPVREETWRLGLDPALLGEDNPYQSVADIYLEPLGLRGEAKRADEQPA